MAIDISALSSQMVTAQALNNLILVWPQESTGIQPQTQIYGGKVSNGEKFLFNYEGEQSVTLSSDITDSYVEQNYAVQDHISLTPELITTQGFIGELNNVVPEELQPLKTAAEKLTVIDAYQPVLSLSGIRAYNAALQAYQAAQILRAQGIQAWDTIGKGGSTLNEIDSSVQGAEFARSVEFRSQNKQQVAFQKFYGYWKARVLFTVQTPWAIFKNCAIQEIVATQAEDTRVVSSFNLTFKTINVASTSLTLVEKSDDFTGRAYFNAAPNQESGMSAVDFQEGTFDPSSFNVG